MAWERLRIPQVETIAGERDAWNAEPAATLTRSEENGSIWGLTLSPHKV